MNHHLHYQHLPWGGYVVRNEHVWQRVISERFEGCPLRPLAIPPSYPCVVWFKGYETYWSAIPLSKDACLRKLGELAEQNKYHEQDLVRPATLEQIAATGDIADTITSIYKLDRWAGVNMRKLCEKFLLEERKHNGMMYVEIQVDALDWDMCPPGIDERGVVKEWLRNLSGFNPSHKGLALYWGRGLAARLHGTHPVLTWDSIVSIGSLRPGGKVHSFIPALQYKQKPMLEIFQDIGHLSQGIDFEEFFAQS